MSSWKHVRSGIAAFGLVVLFLPGTSNAAGLVAQGVDRGLRKPVEPVFFHGHSPGGIAYYCYPRNYWWFYRPYATAGADYARCMPYFHYPPQAYRGGGGGGHMK
jgi:hypothetical protein